MMQTLVVRSGIHRLCLSSVKVSAPLVKSKPLSTTCTSHFQQESSLHGVHSYEDNLLALKDCLAASKTNIYETIRVSNILAPNVGSIKLIQLHRDNAKNAISRQLLQELSTQIELIHEEKGADKTRAVILSSAVDDVFCAGADLKERRTMTESETKDFLRNLRHVFARIASLPIPSIACVSGKALGGGLEMVLCCHMRVFSSNAVVGLPETRLAIIPGAGGTHRLSQAIGLSRARDLIFTGRRIDAYESASIGLCHRLVATDDLQQSFSEKVQNQLALFASISLAREISEGGPIALRAAVAALHGQSQEAEDLAYETVLQTRDRTEALEAFAEKRKARFQGC